MKFNLKYLLLLLCTLPFNIKAQMHSQPINLPKYDYQKMHFGFALGFNSADFVVKKVGNFNLLDSVYSIESSSSIGLNLTILANLRIGNYFDLRFLPTLSFAQRNLDYNLLYNDSTPLAKTKKVESTYLEFPLELKYKSKRVNNYRAYVLAGFKYGIDMVSQAKVKAEDPDVIKLSRQDYGYEIGVGFDFYMTYFKFSPEIKMYTGLKNLIVPENTIFSSPIEALYSKTFTVSFTFE
ncbi:MAG: porin family protein [Bacteroidota bacterium]